MLVNTITYGILVRAFEEGSPVPRKSPFPIDLSPDEAAELNRRAAKYTLPYYEVVRARMMMAADGLDNDAIAARLDTRREVLSQWRKRFFKQGVAGLEERVRPGRFPPELTVEVKALACALPVTLGLPLSRLSVADVARHTQSSGLVARISHSTVWRWRHEDAIRPWPHRCWIFPRDLQFQLKAERMLDLYAQCWHRPACVSIQACRPRPASRCAWRMNIGAAAPGPIWLRWTSIAPRCLGAARRAPALHRSNVWSSKS